MTNSTTPWRWQRPVQVAIIITMLGYLYYQGVPKAYETLALIAIIWGTMAAQEREWIPKGIGYGFLTVFLGMLAAAFILAYFGV